MVSSQSIISQKPTIEHQWDWSEKESLSYLTCSLFKDWSHGFFTKQSQGRSPKELVKVFNPSAEVHQVKQIHSNKILTPSDIKITINDHGEKILSEADGIITKKPLQSVWSASADCTPVLIADLETGTVVAIHAGWRGTAKGIVLEAIARLLMRGSAIENLIFALGPAISGKMYQVSENVAVEAGRYLVSLDDPADPIHMLQILKEIPHSPILEDDSPGKVKLDVRKIISLQLQNVGVNINKIAIAPYCTYQDSDLFFSYRRTHEKNVQWSGIISK